MDTALYDPAGGFFSGGRGTGRGGADFITSPEVGSLFGTLVARFLDAWWDRLGHPDPYLVVDAGAGRGQLARTVLAASPACAPALRYVLVERSAALREAPPEGLVLEPPEIALGPALTPEPDEAPEPVPGLGPMVTAVGQLPAGPFTGTVMANELLDNLPFRIVERAAGGWVEIRVGLGDEGGPGRPGFVEVKVPADEGLAAEADALAGGLDVPDGARLPVQSAVYEWLADVASALRRGAVAVIDYADSAEGLLRRGAGQWLRTYQAHARGGPPLMDPGGQDITAEVCLEALRRSARRAGLAVVEDTNQADWLAALGIESLVDEARAAWHARTANDLAAIRARSLVHEADALLDPAGLGAHRVVVLGRGVA